MEKSNYSPLKPLNLLVLIVTGLVIYVAIALAQSNVISPKVRSSNIGTSGQWTADVRKASGDDIQFNLRSTSDDGRSEYSSGRTMKVSDFQGLNIAEITSAAKTNVSFSLVREAGTINCEGTFSQGLGAGFWKFIPNAGFVSMMQSRGYNNLTDEDLVRATFNNLTGKYIDELKTAGYDKLSFNDLARAASHAISVAYINELRAAGYNVASMDDVIRASNHDINKEFIADMRSAGFAQLSMDDLIRLKNHDISSSYISELKAEGISNITADEAIRAKNHDITADLIRRAKAQGYGNAGLDELIRLNNRGQIK